MTGTSASSQPDYLIIGKVLSAWGLKGEVKIEIITDFPDRFALLDQVLLGDEHTPFKLEGFRKHAQFGLLKLSGLDNPEAARKLAGMLIYVPIAEAVPLGPDEFYEHQIIGLDVWTTDGQHLGRVSEVLFTGSNEVYVVQDKGKEVLIPAIKDVVPEIDLERGRMIVRLIDGLL